MACALPHQIRGAVATDLGFLVKSWVQEHRHSPASKGVPDDLYFASQRKLVLALLRRAWSLVAVDPADADHLYGFVVFELAPPRLHWVYVKEAYRRAGLGEALLRAAFGEALSLRQRILCSHASNMTRALCAPSERHRLVYCPYLLMADVHEAEERGFDGPDSPGP